MQDELRSVLDLMIQQDSTLEIHTTPDVYITQNSTPRDVRKWLRDKEFSQRYCITHDLYRVVARYHFPLFSANIYGSSLGWLEKTTKLTQPIFYLYWKESK